jgi:O-antigen/teichoic acid export membrane protein
MSLTRLVRLLPDLHVSTVFVDQALISGANFIGGVVFARVLGLHEFGRFTLAWMVAEFVVSLQFAAIIQPMLNIGPKQGKALESYYAAVKVQQIIFCLGSAVVVVGVIAIAGRLLGLDRAAELAIPLGAVVVGYQSHNFVRRYLFARHRPFVALTVDVVRYFLQLGGIASAALWWPYQLTSGDGLWIVAAGASTGAVLGSFFIGRLRIDWETVKAVSRRHWNFSKWLVPSAILYWLSGQAFLAMAGIAIGTRAAGSVAAAKGIAGILNSYLLALDNFAPGRAARAFHTNGLAGLDRFLSRLAAVTLIVALAFVGILFVDPGRLAALLYGPQYLGIGPLVRLAGVAYFIYTMNAVLVIWAAAVESTRIVFFSQGMAAMFSIVAAYPLARYAGAEGVLFGAVIAELIRGAALTMHIVLSGRARAPRRSIGAGYVARTAVPELSIEAPPS